jgi:hypothetical protein
MRNEKGTERPSKKAPGKKTAVDRRTDVAAPLSSVPHPADAEELGLSEEEILLYRRRVAEGMYNTREVADEVARRMLKRGDV